MAVRDFTLTITAAAQKLSTALANTERGGPQDESYRQLIITTETDCFLGSSSSLTTSNYGYKVVSAQTLPVVIGPFDAGPVKLSDLWVIGTSGKLHILGVTY